MKIALVILHADTARGGAERYTVDLASALVTLGHEVSILASSFQADPIAGEKVVLSAQGRTRTGRYLRFLDSLDAELARTAYSVVHAMLPVRQCDLYHPHAGIAAEAIAGGHLYKSGWMRRAIAKWGNRLNRRRQQFAGIERQLLQSAHPPVVLCLSSLMQDVVRKFYPALPADRLVRLFNGVDLVRFDPDRQRGSREQSRNDYGIAKDAIAGLILAQDFERKGVRLAIEALAEVNEPQLVLVIGGKPDPKAYQRFAQSLGLGNRVLFVGPIADPPKFYAAGDYFLLPTHFDPCSLAVLEAIAMGLPVITTRQNGASEVMQDGVNGIILDRPGDIPRLSDAMRGMKSAVTRSSMNAASRLLRQKISQNGNVQQLVSVYEVVKQAPAELPLLKD